MANHKSAIKRAGQTAQRNVRNTARRNALRTQVKKFYQAVADDNREEIDKLLRKRSASTTAPCKKASSTVTKPRGPSRRLTLAARKP